MDAIQTAKELGRLIQQDERYIEYYKAKEANDADEKLQQLIGEFNLQRIELNNEMSRETKDTEKLHEIDDKIKSLYADIMSNENMALYNTAKSKMDELLAMINHIITACANGEDPETCDVMPQGGCSGSCSGCSGCH